MLREEPSASIILGFSTQILSSLILNSSMLCGMIVGMISRFSSMILLSSLSMKLLKDSMSESTKLCSSKYFCMSILPYLYINYHPVKYRLAGSGTLPYYLYHIARLWIKPLYGGICLEYLWQFLRTYMIFLENLRFFL